ncbi:alpha/beta hydrolase [Alteribacillus iranensis]|uniref:Carboxylesterase n=1 Tax=Alteribacillus iranensis TaxID=930128 RepID=A0A1I2F0H2_9BACI|nr:alpha/beta fold hydrolase [Alteribacillus iranensis]SFE98509.1 carboxylesterase [Alteribacillus iranensis]
MMRIVPPKSFTYEAGDQAILLLHGFTGSTRDVKKLGLYVKERGWTSHAPLYTGHGEQPERLLQVHPRTWWEDAVAGYWELREKGYTDIVVAGVSLGGVFALKVASELPVTGLVTMSTPIQGKNTSEFYQRVLDYFIEYKKLQGKKKLEIEEEMPCFQEQEAPHLEEIQEMIQEAREGLPRIQAPTYILQGTLDDAVYRKSAPLIYHEVGAKDKSLKWYEKSGHRITTGEESRQVNEDIYTFLIKDKKAFME